MALLPSARPWRWLLAAGFMFWCASGEPAIAADKVRVSYTAPGPQHGILWIADVSGLFKRNNIDIEVIYMPGNISAPSLLAGEVQFGQRMPIKPCRKP